jgi:DNA helicase-2/ATP-dependent DNA helicase PcrA
VRRRERAQAPARRRRARAPDRRHDRRVAPERCACSCARSPGRAGGRGALAERACPAGSIGADAFFDRAEVRDVLAWLRLLVDPRDAAGGGAGAGSRPPIELPAADIARCVQIARRRRIDMVAGLGRGAESPQLAPEARERIARFLQSTAPPRRRSTTSAPTSSCTA